MKKQHMIGLFGGSFDPPHAGHLLVAETAMELMLLNEIWWIPSHGNPLKAHAPSHYNQRAKAIKALAPESHHIVKDLETYSRSKYSVDWVEWAQASHKDTGFVFIAGADILKEFHKWKKYSHLANIISLYFHARPGYTEEALNSSFVQKYQKYEAKSIDDLLLTSPPSWYVHNGAMSNLSSSEIRNQSY